MMTRPEVDKLYADLTSGKTTVTVTQVIELCMMMKRLSMLLADSIKKNPVALSTSADFLKRYGAGEEIRGLFEITEGGKK